MKKVLLGTFLGFVIFSAGLFASFISLQGMRSGGSPILLIVGIILAGIGMFVVFKAGRLDAFKPEIAEIPVAEQVNKGKSILEKNNKIISEWNETNQKRDKLKMLEAAGAAEEDTSLS